MSLRPAFVLVSLLVSTLVPAQITLHSTDFPNAGDSVLTSLTTDAGSNDPTQTGPNYSWDYTSLSAEIQRYEKFDSPFTFTTPFNLLFSVINTTYGRDNYTLTSIPVPAVTLDAAYDFFRKSTGSLRQNGAGYTISGIPLPFLYDNQDTIYRFPMNFADADSCHFKFALPTLAILPFYYGQSGERTNHVDGWGTVTTPYGTFSALRVKSRIEATDTVYVDTLGFGFNIQRPLVTEYKWLATGMKVPVLQINTTTIAGAEVITQVTYIDSTRSGVPQVGLAENTNETNFIVYPNPATEQVVVKYNLSADAKVKIAVTNMIGQTIAVVTNENAAAGERSVTINLEEYNIRPGIYFVTLECAGFKEVKKIVFQ